MANDISARPWKLDTPGGGVIFSSLVNIKFIEWYNPAAIGDTMALTDRNGKTIVAGISELAGGDTQTFNIENWFEGLIMPTLVSGVVYVHVR